MVGVLAWERLGDQFFRVLDGPAMRWSLKMNHVNISAAECGGVIVAWDKDDIVVRLEAGGPARQRAATLFSSEGNVYGQFRLDFGSIVGIEVLPDETVVAVTNSGLARHYTDLGRNFVQLHLPASVESFQLTDSGYIAQLAPPEGDPQTLRFAEVTKCTTNEPRHRVLTLDPGPQFKLYTWFVLPHRPEQGLVGGFALLDKEGSLHCYDSELTPRSRRVVATNVPLGYVSLNCDAGFAAFSDGRSRTTVYTLDFQETVFESTSLKSHTSIHWVGSDAFLLKTGDSEVDVVSLKPSNVKRQALSIYLEDDEVALRQEPDGVRIFGNENQSLLMPVAKSTLDTFKVGSLAPSSILYSCVDQIDAGSPKSDQTVKLLEQSQLARAVDTCVSAAYHEMDVKTQKRLLRAASFGKSMLTVYDSTRYLAALTKLRILNAVRSLPQDPIFITNKQLESLGTSQLLRRMEARQLWAEAVSIAELEQVPVEPVYIEWACWVIQNRTESSDEQLCAELEAKLGKLEAYSRSKMAQRALEQGRQKLALTLLESEPVAKERVLILLEMNMAQPALEQAIISGNVYLVDYVLSVLAEQLSFPQLMRVIGGNKIAIERQKQLIKSKPNSKNELHEFLYQMDCRFESLQSEFDDIVHEENVDTKLRMLRALESKFSGLNKTCLPDSRACGNWADLITIQKQLRESYEIDVVGKSAVQTITALLKLPQVAQAQKLKSKLGVSDRQFWWLRILALVDRREFELLREFAQSKKSPIGYRPFFDVCLEAGNHDYAAKFIDMISDASTEDKVRMYIKAKQPSKARELAVKSRNPQLISLVGN